MEIEWKEASIKFKIAWLSWLIGAPVLSLIIWRLQIPYVEIYLIIIALAAWTSAILYKRRKKRMAEVLLEKSDSEQIISLERCRTDCYADVDDEKGNGALK
jgi:hypothetical protein